METSSLPAFHVLIVEDDRELRAGLRDYFELEGYGVTTAADGEEALACLRQHRDFDLVLLDNMLPKMTGFDVLRSTQLWQDRPPVLMMTACGQQHDVLNGFDLGVDDYVVKPFSAEMLLARVKAVLRRRKPPAERPMNIERLGEVQVNFSAHTAHRGDQAIHLTVMEFDLLRYLIQNEGRIVSREELLRQVWNVPEELETRTVDRHVASLRRKLEIDRTEGSGFLHTIYGRGYQFKRLS